MREGVCLCGDLGKTVLERNSIGRVMKGSIWCFHYDKYGFQEVLICRNGCFTPMFAEACAGGPRGLLCSCLWDQEWRPSQEEDDDLLDLWSWIFVWDPHHWWYQASRHPEKPLHTRTYMATFFPDQREQEVAGERGEQVLKSLVQILPPELNHLVQVVQLQSALFTQESS